MSENSKELIIINSVVDGDAVLLETVNDNTFAQKTMGEGIAIIPSGNCIKAPFNATVQVIAQNKHAIGLTGDNGVELLIHIGINTISLEGEGFKSLVNINEHVEAGDSLIEFDKEAMESKGLDTTIMMIILNHMDYNQITVHPSKPVKANDSCVLEIE